MATLRIIWEQEVYETTDQLEAAKDCLSSIQNGEALCFTVTDESTGKSYSVDLGEPDEDAVLEIK